MMSGSQQTILCYGDSNTWGANPDDLTRFSWQTRWTGVLQCLLGDGVRVIEEGLSSRTTGFDDPLIPDRNGLASFPMVRDTHQPFDQLIVMLGTNDAKSRFRHSPDDAADAIERLVRLAQEVGAQPLIVAPPPLREPIRFPEFAPSRALSFSRALTTLYAEVATATGARYLNAGSLITVSPLDGVHLDETAHTTLAQALAALLQQG